MDKLTFEQVLLTQEQINHIERLCSNHDDSNDYMGEPILIIEGSISK